MRGIHNKLDSIGEARRGVIVMLDCSQIDLLFLIHMTLLRKGELASGGRWGSGSDVTASTEKRLTKGIPKFFD